MATPHETPVTGASAAATTPAADAAKSAPRKVVTVFGASWCTPGDALYTESEKLGRLLAESDYGLMNGGYAGTMEGSAKGATAAGGTATGVIVPDLFKNRAGGNAYLSTTVAAPTLLTRIEAMIEGASYFVVMNGTLGTLTELAAINNIAALAGIGHYTRPFIVVYRHPWEAVMTSVAEALNMPADHRACLHYVDDAEAAVAAINAEHARRVEAAAATTAEAGDAVTTAAVGGAAAVPVRA